MKDEKLEENEVLQTKKKLTPGKWMGAVIFIVAILAIIGLIVGYIIQVINEYNGDITARLIVDLITFVMGAVWIPVGTNKAIEKWKGGNK